MFRAFTALLAKKTFGKKVASAAKKAGASIKKVLTKSSQPSKVSKGTSQLTRGKAPAAKALKNNKAKSAAQASSKAKKANPALKKAARAAGTADPKKAAKSVKKATKADAIIPSVTPAPSIATASELASIDALKVPAEVSAPDSASVGSAEKPSTDVPQTPPTSSRVWGGNLPWTTPTAGFSPNV